MAILNTKILEQLRKVQPVAPLQSLRGEALHKHKELYDINWLRDSLQVACELEFFTVPPYLTAMWSIKDTNHFAVHSIRSVAIEEMLHLGLACNMLKALGRTPNLSANDKVPTYPSELPGSVHTGTNVALDVFSKEAAKVFMIIEQPEEPDESHRHFMSSSNQQYDTIGLLYDAILEAFKELKPSLELVGQITGPKAPMTISSVADANKAIHLIKTQGEGSDVSPIDPSDGDLAHYYRFGELYEGKRYVQSSTGEWGYTGDEIPIPEVYQAHPIPKGGYDRSSISKRGGLLLDKFNYAYTNMIFSLEEAWRTGIYDGFMKALEQMFEMEILAKQLFQQQEKLNKKIKGLIPEFQWRERPPK